MDKILFLLLFLGASCTTDNNKTTVLSKHFEQEIRVSLDSVAFSEIVSPRQSYVDNHNIVMVQTQGDYFVKVFDKVNLDLKIQIARRGRASNEYLAPGLVIGSPEKVVSLYQEQPQKYDTYSLINGKAELDTSVQCALPLDDRIKSRHITKTYSYLHYVDSSRVIGSAFTGNIPEVDVIDIKNSMNISGLDFLLDMSDSKSASPYIFRADFFNGYFVVAYEYVNRLEVYKLLDNQLQLQYVIGDSKTQVDLFEQEAFGDMVIYYSGVAVDDNKIYALYYGLTESLVYGDTPMDSYIEVFDLKSGESLDMYKIDGQLDNLMIDRGEMKLYLMDPNKEESTLFSLDIQ